MGFSDGQWQRENWFPIPPSRSGSNGFNKDTATAALAGSNHAEMNSGQVSPAVWMSEIGPTATTDMLLASSKVLKEDLSG